MSAPGTGTGQEQQNRLKILEDLQQQKKRLQMQTTTAGGTIPVQSKPTKDGATGPTRGPGESRNLDARQRQALQHAQSNSLTYFITQDSSFGNLILPVIPRVSAD